MQKLESRTRDLSDDLNVDDYFMLGYVNYRIISINTNENGEYEIEAEHKRSLETNEYWQIRVTLPPKISIVKS